MDRPAGFREIFDRKRTGYAQKQVKAYAKQNRLCRASIRDRLRQTAGQYRRALEMAAAAAGGAVFAGAHILGGIAPFGVALAAAVPEGLFLPALFGALFGYLWFPAPAVPWNMPPPSCCWAGCGGPSPAAALWKTRSSGAGCAGRGLHAGGRGGCGLRPGR